MSAKHGKKSASKSVAHPSAPGVPATEPAMAAAGAGATAAEASLAWIDSPDPRKRKLGRLVLAGIWLYVAALWLLALDQTFNWGIFGPKVPPLP